MNMRTRRLSLPLLHLHLHLHLYLLLFFYGCLHRASASASSASASASTAFVHISAPRVPLPLPLPSWCANSNTLARTHRISSTTIPSVRTEVDGEGKVPVTLGDYKDGAITVSVKQRTVSEQDLDKAFQTRNKPYKLTPVRVVEEGGTKIGHTIICDWECFYVGGGNQAMRDSGILRPGISIPKGKRTNFELELKEGYQEPWNSFVRSVAVGMGQMEQKTFEAPFPEDFKIAELQGVQARVQLLVRKICRKEANPVDPRTEIERKEELRQEMQQALDAQVQDDLDDAIRVELMKTCNADTDKVEKNVSWAKFGEKSLSDYKWHLIMEKIALSEGVDFRDVPQFLRSHAKVNFV